MAGIHVEETGSGVRSGNHQSYKSFVNRAKNHEERASCIEFPNGMIGKYRRRSKDELAAYKAETCLEHHNAY